MTAFEQDERPHHGEEEDRVGVHRGVEDSVGVEQGEQDGGNGPGGGEPVAGPHGEQSNGAGASEEGDEHPGHLNVAQQCGHTTHDGRVGGEERDGRLPSG